MSFAGGEKVVLGAPPCSRKPAINKLKVKVYLDTLLSQCVRPKLSSFKFSSAFGFWGSSKGFSGSSQSWIYDQRKDIQSPQF